MMITFKKQFLLAGAILLVSLVVITSEGERKREIDESKKIAAQEADRKEAVARDPQGNVVAIPEAVLRQGRLRTFGEAAGRVAPRSGTSSFVRGVAARAMTPVDERIAPLPLDAQTNIAGYLEQDKYDLWKTLNTPADQLAFRDSDLVTVSHNKTTIQVSVRSMVTGDITQRFTVPRSLTPRNRNSFLLSADGKRIAIFADNPDRIDVWDTVTGTIINSLAYPQSPDSYGELIAFTSDGTNLAVQIVQTTQGGVQANEIQLLHVTSGEIIALPETIYFNDREKYAMNQNTFVAASKFKPITFWNTQSGTKRPVTGLHISGHLEAANNVIFNFIFSNDGKIFAVSSRVDESGLITLFNYNSQQDILTPKVSIKENNGHALKRFSHDNTILATVDIYDNLYLFNTITGELLQKIKVRGHEEQVAFSPGNNIIAIASFDSKRVSTIQLWKKTTALQDALQKQQRIHELRSQAATAVASSSIASSSPAPSSPSSSSTTTSAPSTALSAESAVEPVVEPAVGPLDTDELAAATIHMQPAADESGETTIMDQPD